MIVRARPEVDEELILGLLSDKHCEKQRYNGNCFFYNSGANALLEFLLLHGGNKRVGIQVFTCSTVKDAILKANDIPVFFDIDPDCFSTNYQQIFEKIDQIDILILTHLFGIPNPDVEKINNLCKENNVVLINDLCQTYHSKVNGMHVEDISENFFYSFFYDKPISCMYGGMLSVGTQYVEQMHKRYDQLPKRNNKRGKRHLHQLLLFGRLTSPLYYKRDFRTGTLWKFLLELYPMGWSNMLLNKIINSRLFHIIDRILCYDSNKNSEIERLSDIEIFYILHMMDHFNSNNQTLMEFFIKNGLQIPEYLRRSDCECAFSKRGIVRKEYIDINGEIEIGLYNWPNLLSSDANKYPNAQLVTENYVNIPLYCNEILNDKKYCND